MSERPDTATLLQQGLFHHRQGQFELAMERYVEALQGDPENAEALYYVAVVACQQGDLQTGIDIARRSLSFNPRQPRAHNVLGQALQRQKQFDEALACYDKALEYDANFVDALANRANLMGETGRHAHAIAAYDKVLALRPGLPQDWCNRGQSQHALGQPANAIASYDRALALDPKYALAHHNRAEALKHAGRLEEAVAGFARAAQLQPEVADFHGSHALALRDLGQSDAALAAIDRAIARRPDFAEAHANRGSILAALDRFDDALAAYDRAAAIKPNLAEAWLGRGIALNTTGSEADALENFTRALSLQPDMPLALYHSGMVQMECAQFAAARSNLERAARLAPDDDEIAYSLSQIQLLQGDWDKGFENFERRSNPRRPAYTPLALPRWGGEQPGNYRLLLLTEQGLGDTIQFSRYANLLAARGYPVVLLAHEEMAPLLRGLGGIEVVTAPEQLARDPRPALWLPLMSVMQRLHLAPDSIPEQAPYLAADGARAAAWAERLGSGAFKIGIAWQGRMEGKRAARAAALSAFAPLAEIAGVRLISLQKAPGSAQIAAVAFGDRVERPISDTDFSPDALPDIAALMASLDLIVSIDTMSAHLAGALGRPVFVALRRVADWRWLLDRDDSPWYPSMRLFRQSREGEWSDVFARIAAAVCEMIDRKSPSGR